MAREAAEAREKRRREAGGEPHRGNGVGCGGQPSPFQPFVGKKKARNTTPQEPKRCLVGTVKEEISKEPRVGERFQLRRQRQVRDIVQADRQAFVRVGRGELLHPLQPRTVLDHYRRKWKPPEPEVMRKGVQRETRGIPRHERDRSTVGRIQRRAV